MTNNACSPGTKLKYTLKEAILKSTKRDQNNEPRVVAELHIDAQIFLNRVQRLSSLIEGS